MEWLEFPEGYRKIKIFCEQEIGMRKASVALITV